MPPEVAGGRFSLELFESLDAEYSERPFHAPVPRDEQSFQDKARRRIATITRQLETDFEGKVVLELGCGHGWLTAYLPELGRAAEAIGVDPRRYETWDRHTDPRVRMMAVDLAADRPFDDASVDIVISGAVFEHVTRPVDMLAAVWDLLAPGGRAWLYFNLYRGPQASHRYNEVRFPWPHLLFDDAICQEFYERRHGRRRVRFAWVNKMTLGEYLHVTHELGFRIVSVSRHVVPIDLPFYSRFEDKLGRYPALDLETDFATLILEKPPPAPGLASRPPRDLPGLDYLGRERALRSSLRAMNHGAGAPENGSSSRR